MDLHKDCFVSMAMLVNLFSRDWSPQNCRWRPKFRFINQKPLGTSWDLAAASERAFDLRKQFNIFYCSLNWLVFLWTKLMFTGNLLHWNLLNRSKVAQAPVEPSGEGNIDLPSSQTWHRNKKLSTSVYWLWLKYKFHFPSLQFPSVTKSSDQEVFIFCSGFKPKLLWPTFRSDLFCQIWS